MWFLVAVFVKFFYHKEKDFPLQNRLPCWLPWSILEKICYFSNVNYLKLNVLEKNIFVRHFFLKNSNNYNNKSIAFIPVHAFISRNWIWSQSVISQKCVHFDFFCWVKLNKTTQNIPLIQFWFLSTHTKERELLCSIVFRQSLSHFHTSRRNLHQDEGRMDEE